MSPAERLARQDIGPDSPRPEETRLRFHRRRLGLSLKSAAPQAGIHLGTLAQIEVDEHCPSIQTALRLARFYGVSVEDLFGHLVPQPSPGPNS